MASWLKKPQNFYPNVCIWSTTLICTICMIQIQQIASDLSEFSLLNFSLFKLMILLWNCRQSFAHQNFMHAFFVNLFPIKLLHYKVASYQIRIFPWHQVQNYQISLEKQPCASSVEWFSNSFIPLFECLTPASLLRIGRTNNTPTYLFNVYVTKTDAMEEQKEQYLANQLCRWPIRLHAAMLTFMPLHW